MFKPFAESIVAILNRMIPLHSITLFCDSPDFGSCLFFVSGLAKVVSLLLFKVSADWALSNIRDFYSAALHLFLELLDLIFYSLFFHPLELFFCLFFLVFLGLLRPYLVLESHLVFSSGSTSGFSGFSVSLSVSGFVSGTVWFPESVSGSGVTSGFSPGVISGFDSLSGSG